MSAFTGTIAWFSSMSSTSISGANVAVALVSGGCTIDEINLIKFEYGFDSFGNLNYAEPELGKVKKYAFNGESFGEYTYQCTGEGCNNKTYSTDELDFARFCPADHSHELGNKTWSSANNAYIYHCNSCDKDYKESELDIAYYCPENHEHTLANEQWKPIDTMNVFDPAEMKLKGNEFNLRSLNCNAIYELKFGSDGGIDYLLKVISNRFPITITDSSHQVQFTSCVDFDVFSQADLTKYVGLKTEEGHVGDPLYYPDYIIGSVANRSNWDLEEIYYRISYYADMEDAVHSNFYSLGAGAGDANPVLYKSVLDVLDTTQTSIAINADYKNLMVGDTFQLSTTLNNPNEMNDTVTYSVSEADSAIATVSNTGLITAVSEGMATINITALGITKKSVINVTNTAPTTNYRERVPVTFGVGGCVVYINVNYAKDQLIDYVDKIDSKNTVRTIRDFNFSCDFLKVE